jgi:hypothetical protein
MVENAFEATKFCKLAAALFEERITKFMEEEHKSKLLGGSNSSINRLQVSFVYITHTNLYIFLY